jgi:hypothetical protein
MARTPARDAPWRPARLLQLAAAQLASEEGVTGAFPLDSDAPIEGLL